MALIDEVRAARLADRAIPSPEKAKQIREDAGVSQARLAQEVGVHRMSIVRWENGSRKPRGDGRIAYALVLRELEALMKEQG